MNPPAISPPPPALLNNNYNNSNFFTEYNETIHLIHNKILQQQYDDDEQQSAQTQICNIFNRYLEYPTLLDPYLNTIINPLTQFVLNFLNEYFDDNNDSNDVSNNNKKKVHQMVSILTILQTLCKVRGYKAITKFLPHEASNLEFIVYALQTFSSSSVLNWESEYVLLHWLGMLLAFVPFDLMTIDSSSPTSHHHDCCANACLIEQIIELCKDRLSHTGPTREASSICLAHLLSRPDMEESVFLTNFITWATFLCKNRVGTPQNFGTLNALQQDKSVMNGNEVTFCILGIVSTFSTLFKIAPRASLVKCINVMWEPMLLLFSTVQTLVMRKLLIKLFTRVGCSYLPPQVADWRYERGKRSLLENLNANEIEKINHSQFQAKGTKIVTGKKTAQAGCKFNEVLTEAITNSIEDVVELLLQGLRDPSTAVRWSSAKGIGRITERLPLEYADEVVEAVIELCSPRENDNAWHGACLSLAELSRKGLLLPSHLELVVPITVKALQFDVRRGQASVGAHVRDAACYVCWAFARSFSPKVMAPYVDCLGEEMILACILDREINCRRAASAAFQENVGRQGAENFRNGIDILTRADYFTVGNRYNAYMSVAFDVAALSHQYRKAIINRLASIKIFHWDIEIRILASKSLGKLSTLDPHYVTSQLLDALIANTLNKDVIVRHGALLGVAEIILALANSKNILGVNSHSLNEIIHIVPNIESARLYRGKGGEFMRAGCCRLIECISLSEMKLQVKMQVRLLDSIDASLGHPNENIQLAAASALKALMKNYFPVFIEGPSDRLRNRVIKKYTDKVSNESNPAMTRGFSLALGKLPKKLLAPDEETLITIITCLGIAAKAKNLVGDKPDAETRRNAINAIAEIVVTVGINGSVNTKKVYYLNPLQVHQIFEIYLEALNDYGIDRRGDVGSWCRIAAIKGIEGLLFQIARESGFIDKCHVDKGVCDVVSLNPSLSDMQEFLHKPPDPISKSNLSNIQELIYSSLPAPPSIFLDFPLCCKVIGSLLKQLSEKLDSVRSVAGSSLERILCTADPKILFIPERNILKEALKLRHTYRHTSITSSDSDFPVKNISWSNPCDTFPLVMRAVNINEYFEYIVAGILISVGGLTESVVKSAWASLSEWVNALKEHENMKSLNKLWSELIKLLQAHKKEDRVILPLLKTLDKLIRHGCFDDIIINSTTDNVKSLLVQIRSEQKGCMDVKRLFAIVDVLLSLFSSPKNVVHEDILPILMKLLVHRYPRVRRYVAEQLYVKTLESDGLLLDFVDEENVQDLLLNTIWDDEFVTAVSARNSLAQLLRIDLPEKERTKDIQPPHNTSAYKHQRDELDCYSSLVHSAGR